jgi:hypothetical protein
MVASQSIAGVPRRYQSFSYTRRHWDRVLAVSEFMLKHFEERGFSLRTLCLALQSTLRYGPGTGKQLPTAVAARRSRSANSLEPIGSEILLNVPDRFRNGKPDIDFLLDGDGFEPRSRSTYSPFRDPILVAP